MKQSRVIVGGVLTIFAVAALFIAFTLPTVSIMGAGGSVYSFLASLENLAEMKKLFAGTILFVAAAVFMLLCSVVGIVCICKGQGGRGVLLGKLIAILALLCALIATVLFAVEMKNIVTVGTIVPLVCVFVAFMGTMMLPTKSKE